MEKCNYKRIDAEHNVYQCEACGHIVKLEADGPFENGLDYCAHCGREIAYPFQCDCGYSRRRVGRHSDRYVRRRRLHPRAILRRLPFPTLRRQQKIKRPPAAKHEGEPL